MDPNSPCRFCGKSLQSHLTHFDGQDCYRPCLESVRSHNSALIQESATADGTCLICGQPILSHVEFQTLSFEVCSRPIVVRRLGVPLLFPVSLELCSPGEWETAAPLDQDDEQTPADRQ